MPFITSRRTSKRELKTSEAFLRTCFRLILFWVIVLISMIGLEALVNTKKDSNSWAKPLFTVACALDVLFTGRIIPITLKVIRDDIYRDKVVKRNIWKLRLLIVLNLICSLSFIVWSWMADDNQKIIKWLLFSLLILGIFLVKGWFTYLYIFLKRYTSKMFKDPIFLQREPDYRFTEETVIVEDRGNYLTNNQNITESPQNPNVKQEESNLSQNPPWLPSTEE